MTLQSAQGAGPSAPTSEPSAAILHGCGEVSSAPSADTSTASSASDLEWRLATIKALRAQRRKGPRVSRKEKPETAIQRAILSRLSSLPYLKLERNNRGAKGHVHFGLGEGAADLVGVVKTYCICPHPQMGQARGRSQYLGRFFALEIKAPGKEPEPHQVKWAEEVRALGGYVGCAHSVEEALKCVEEARYG